MLPEPKKRGILFLAYYYPPIHSIAVWRNYFLAEAMHASGNSVAVVTSSIQKKVQKPLGGLSIIEIPAFDYRSFKQKYLSKSGFHYTEDEKKSWFRKSAIRIINSFPFNIILGEGGLKYIYNAYQYGKQQVENGKISHIYSSYRPMADHYLAWLLKRKYPQLHWTADFRDLPFDRVYRLYYGYRFQTWVLRKLLEKADLVTSFSEGIAFTLSKEIRQKMIHIPNGIFYNPDAQTIALCKHFTISYTGSLFQEERSPANFFSLIKEMIENKEIDVRDFQIVYAGKDGSQWMNIARQYGLETVCINEGFLSHLESRMIQQSSHINLMLSSSHPEFKGVFTGKFFEYLSASRPILSFISGDKDDELQSAFDKYNLGMISFSNATRSELAKAFILQLYQNWQNTGACPYTFSEDLEKDFSWTRSINIWESNLHITNI